MKAIILIFAAVLLLSCEEQSHRKFLLRKHDKWHGGYDVYIECDSVDMLAPNHIVYWVDGRKANLRVGDKRRA